MSEPRNWQDYVSTAEREKRAKWRLVLPSVAARSTTRALITEIAQRPCEASEWHGIPEDGISRCVDPNFVEMYRLDEHGTEVRITVDDLRLCIPCRMRAAIR